MPIPLGPNRKKILLIILGIILIIAALAGAYAIGFHMGNNSPAPAPIFDPKTLEQLTGSILSFDQNQMKVKVHDETLDIKLTSGTTFVGHDTNLEINKNVSLKVAKVDGIYTAVQVRIL